MPRSAPPPSTPPLGQHFLTSSEYRQRILAAIQPKATDYILEIGPGKGALTRDLLRAKLLVGVEKDRALAERLQHMLSGEERLIIHHGDFLEFSFSTLERYGGRGWRVVGNLPYYVATPILQKLMEADELFRDIWVTVQKEVADRMCAEPRSSSYGFFSLFCQYHADLTRLFDIPSTAFAPAPRVVSTFLRLDLKEKKPAGNEEAFIMFLKTIFAHRRKTVWNNLQIAGFSPSVLGKTFENQRLHTKARPQDLFLDDCLALFQGLEEARKAIGRER